MERLTRALSIRQPLAELILTGEKTWEFRSRVTHIRGRVFIYATKTLATVDGFPMARALVLPRGVIVGSVDIIGTLDDLNGDLDGDYGWELARPRRYRRPLKAKGMPQPGFWRPTF
jgi:predicted transcriptional regulator